MKYSKKSQIFLRIFDLWASKMPNYSVFRPSPSDYWNKKEKLRPPSSIVKVLYRCLIADSGSRWLKAGVCSKKKEEKREKRTSTWSLCCDSVELLSQRAATRARSLQQSGASCLFFLGLFCTWLVGAASLSLQQEPNLLTWHAEVTDTKQKSSTLIKKLDKHFQLKTLFIQAR